ncbi:MAG: hypothetical protein JXR58_13895 [Bacteroidales bacterium]|nr:hypothetical protein [Bacteroidales bacterium]
MKKAILISLLFVIISVLYSCKKCYTCQVRKSGIDKMIDFGKTCNEAEFQTMEDSIRVEYPDSLGYYVICQ